MGSYTALGPEIKAAVDRLKACNALDLLLGVKQPTAWQTKEVPMTPQQAIDDATRIVKQAQDNGVYQVVLPRQVVQVLLGVVLAREVQDERR